MAKYTTEEINFLKDNRSKYTIDELTVIFNDRFETKRTKRAINTYCKKHHIRAGTSGRFEKGNKPWSTGLTRDEWRSHFSDDSYANLDRGLKTRTLYKIGDTVLMKIGDKKYPYIVISDTPGVPFKKRIYPKSRYVWEQNNGPMPDDSIIIALDGDVTNTDISNLRCISNRTKIQITTNKWWRLDPELKDLAIAYADLINEIKNRRVERRKNNE